MTDREKLEKIIAQDLCPSAWFKVKPHYFSGNWIEWRDTARTEALRMARSLIAAAEREGFRFLGPDDGR